MSTNTAQHPAGLGIALAISLGLHIGVFVTAAEMRDRGWLLTQLRPDWKADDFVAQREPEQTDEEEDVETLTPGLENGAPAVVSWIGYEEYKEHLAEHAEVDQALFVFADTPGDANQDGAAGDVSALPPDAALEPTPINEHEIPVDVKLESAEAVVEDPVESPAEMEAVPDEAATPSPVERTPVEPEASQPPEVSAREIVKETTPKAEESVERASELPEPTVEPVRENERAEESVESLEEDVVDEESQDASDEPEVDAELAPMPDRPSELVPESSQPTDTGSESSSGQDAAGGSDKDSPATSQREVIKTEWNNGQPLAAKGLEILPYPLFRHIAWDSKDILFSQRLSRMGWEGRIKRNPIVSIRFNRAGAVGEVRIIRPSGFGELDKQYLASWMARWSARGSELSKLPEGALTAPLLLEIGFIEEKKEQTAPAGR